MNFRNLSLILVLISITLVLSCSTSSILFKIEPSEHNFGQVNIGQTHTFDFIITNKKSVQMTLSVVSFSTGEFSEITAAQGKTITAKGTLTITVRFEPILPGGAKMDTMHIEWTDVNGKTGKKDVKLQGEAVPVPSFEVTPTTHDFNIILVGNDATEDFTVTNAGTADLILSSFNFTNFTTEFSISAGGAVPITIQPGMTHNFTIKFAPTVDGVKATSLEISHNAVNVATPAQLAINGEGTTHSPGISLNQTSPWDFGTVSSNSTFTDTLQIESNGLNDLLVTSADLTTGTFFTVAGVEDSAGNPITLPHTVTIGDYIEVNISFTPTSTGNYQDTLTLIHDATNTASPINLNLTGAGKTPTVQTFNYTGSATNWNVPAGCTSAVIEGIGAQGGINDSRQNGGYGARMKGTFTLTPGQTINVIVGQQGSPGSTRSWSRCGGGSGGSFAWISTANMPLIAAGGGGGKGYLRCSNPMNASITTSGVAGRHPGGTNGNGGTGGTYLNDDGAGGGGGWLTDGTGILDYKGKKIYNGSAAGGVGYNNGGFGGGGASSNTAGGGGGYSGGGGGWYGFNTSVQYNGGGGGSYNSGTAQDNAVSTRTGNGTLTITY